MSSITANTSAYYQLPSGSTGTNTGTSSTLPSQPSLSTILAQDSAASPDSSADNAFVLNLSPQAQQYLSSTGSSSGNGASSGDSFTLTTRQQQTINTILEKYKDAPDNQATYDAIQNDLNAAGLGASQLSQEDAVKSFNPTQMLIDDLNGNYSDPTTTSTADSSAEQTKSTNYMQQILTEWKNMAGNNTSATPSSGTTTQTA